MQKYGSLVKQLQDTREKILDRTLGTCHYCFQIIPMKIIERRGKVFLKKECDDCQNKELILLDNDPDLFQRTVLNFSSEKDFLSIGKPRYNKNVNDKMNEEAITIALALTSKCNLSCPICMLKLPPLSLLLSWWPDVSLDEIVKLKKYKNKVIALSGGEPTLREDLPNIIKTVIKTGNIPLLCTNGIKMCNENYVKELKEAGLKIVNISFDGFRDNIYKVLRGKKLLYKKLKALKNLRKYKMYVWLTAVIVKGVNEDQIPSIIKFASLGNDFIVGVTFSQLYTGNLKIKEKITSSDILKIIEKTTGIKSEQFMEEKRFYFNIHKLLEFLNKNAQKIFPSLRENLIYLKVKGKKYEPLFPSSKLKEMNKVIEMALTRKSKFKSLMFLIKNIKTFLNRGLITLALIFISSRFNFQKASVKSNSHNILKIRVNNVVSSFNEDLNRILSVGNRGPVPYMYVGS